MHITQIYISSNDEIPVGPVSSYMRSIQEAATGHAYKCFNNNAIEIFLRENFPEEILSAYRDLQPYAFKADLARYCILYRLGGWYIDAGLEWCLPSFEVSDKIELIAFRDMQEYWGNSWACANGLIYSKPQHPALKLAIERAVSNIRNSYYGFTPLCPTGPMLWGSVIAQTGMSEGLIIGDFKHTTPLCQHKNTCCILPGGQIIARWKPLLPAGGRLSDTGNKGLNDYMSLWKAKEVYRKKGTNKEIFTQYYVENSWGDCESKSGSGSNLKQTSGLIKSLPIILKKYGVKSILDAPCGDFNWFKKIRLEDEMRYLGVDIVEQLVEDNNNRYANSNLSFKCLNIISDPIPKSDLIIMRDCLVHLSFRDIKSVIESVLRSQSTYLLATHFTNRPSNADIKTGDWRPINLLKYPFLFPDPKEVLVEGCTEGGGAYYDKSLALWRIDELMCNF